MEFGGLTDVETRGVLGLEDELVYSFRLVEDVVWERDLVGLCVDGNW